MAAVRERDPFQQLSRILDAPHSQNGSIKRACAAVEECIASNRDNLRGFFDRCFPTLLKRVFGYDDFEASWLNLVTKPGKEEDARALIDLLSPKGLVVKAMQSADADQLIKFIFPSERLPSHTQELLKTASGRRELENWPQYRGHIRPDSSGRTQVYLNVFEYFLFWNAFYVLRGGRGLAPDNGRAGERGLAGGLQAPRSYMSDIRRMGTSFISGFHHFGSSMSLSVHPYYTLLRMYLSHFLPRTRSAGSPLQFMPAATTMPGPKLSSLVAALPGNTTYDADPGGMRLAGDNPSGGLVLSILLEFWLTDLAEPVPADLAAEGKETYGPGSGGMGMFNPSGFVADRALVEAASPLSPHSSPYAASRSTAMSAAAGLVGGSISSSLRVLSFQPPGEELVEALSQLVRYIHVLEEPEHPASRATHGGAGTQGPRFRPAQGRDLWLPDAPVRTMTAATGRGAAPMQGHMLLGAPASPAVQAVSRKLYRFLRRSFAQWPLQSSTSLIPMIQLWLSVITPWANPGQFSSSPSLTPGMSPRRPTQCAAGHGTQPGTAGWQESTPHRRAELVYRPGSHSTPEGGATVQGAVGSYTPEWRSHVLAHLPFYTILIPCFIELSAARMSFRAEGAAGELLVLMRALHAAGPQLVAELREAEGAYNRFMSSAMRRAEVMGPPLLMELLPWLAEQTADWEGAASAGAPTNPPMQADPAFHMFTTTSRGAATFMAGLLKGAQTQVHSEVRDELAATAMAVLPLTDVPHDSMDTASTVVAQEAHGRAFPRAGSWAAVQYKGDWLRRPVASNEVAFLVRVLLWLSGQMNHLLGLDRPWLGEEVEEPAETVLEEGLRALRRRGIRVNLRFLAEVQTIAWLVIMYFLAGMLVPFLKA